MQSPWCGLAQYYLRLEEMYIFALIPWLYSHPYATESAQTRVILFDLVSII